MPTTQELEAMANGETLALNDRVDAIRVPTGWVIREQWTEHSITHRRLAYVPQ